MLGRIYVYCVWGGAGVLTHVCKYESQRSVPSSASAALYCIVGGGDGHTESLTEPRAR